MINAKKKIIAFKASLVDSLKERKSVQVDSEFERMNEKIEKNEKNENQNAMKSNSTNYDENVDDIFDSKIYRNFLIVNIFVIDDFNANEFEMKNEKNELNEQKENNYID